MKLLEVKNLSAGYGDMRIVENINIYLNKGEIVAILGPNGSGKSTILRAIVGVIQEYNGKIFEGEIFLKGKNITGKKPYELIKMGMVFLPDGGKVFPGMSVKENLEMGGFLLGDEKLLKKRIEKVLEVFPVLKSLLNRKAFMLSGGERQILAIARAMIMEPEIYLLDEPSVGLSAGYQKMLFEKLREIKKETGIIVVEQNAKLALRYSDRGYIIKEGKIGLKGESEEIIKKEDVFKLL